MPHSGKPVDYVTVLYKDVYEDDKNNTHTGKSKPVKPLSSCAQRNGRKNYKQSYVKNRTHKVLILGDSHARRCAPEVKNKLNNEYDVSGFVNPGSDMKIISESAKRKIAQLTNNDYVVLWGVQTTLPEIILY